MINAIAFTRALAQKMEAYINDKHFYPFTADMIIIPAIAYICALALAMYGVSRAAQRISGLKRDLQQAENRAEDSKRRAREAEDRSDAAYRLWMGTEEEEALIKTIMQRQQEAAEKLQATSEQISLMGKDDEAINTWNKEGKMWKKGTDDQEAWVKTIMQREREEIERLRGETELRE